MRRYAEREQKMRFLSGLLKTVAILVMLAATAGCTAVAVMAQEVEVYWIMALVWVCALLVVLTIWGTGLALSAVYKLKRKIQWLEYKYEKPADEDFSVTGKSYTNADSYADLYNTYRAAGRKSSRKWIVIVIVTVVILAVIVAGLFVLKSGLFTFGRPKTVVLPQPTMPQVIYDEAEIFVPVTEAPQEPEETPAAQVTGISLGQTASTEFMDMSFEKCVVQRDIKLSVKTGNVTRITGPDPLAGRQYVCLSGKIKNKTNAALPVNDFYLGKIDLDGYVYEVSANDCDILTPDGQTVSKIDPLMSYDFRIYTAIPEEVAAGYSSCSFTYGFYDDFENTELSYTRAFSDDPIAECPYQYTVAIR